MTKDDLERLHNLWQEAYDDTNEKFELVTEFVNGLGLEAEEIVLLTQRLRDARYNILVTRIVQTLWPPPPPPPQMQIPVGMVLPHKSVH